jgi:tetratricopeptide (TPR) repeat protein
MRAYLFSLIFLLIFFSELKSNDNISLLLKNGNVKEASNLLQEKYNNKTLSFDEFLQFYYLKEFLGTEKTINDFSYWAKKSANQYAYSYALFRSPAVIGESGLKNKHQLQYINELIKDENCPAFVKSSAIYDLAIHYFYKHDYKRMNENYAQIKAIEDWLMTGPFYNISGSGMDKIYEPEKYAKKDKTFDTEFFGKVFWFDPASIKKEGWITFTYNFPVGTGKIFYAQSFINSPQEQDLILELGFGGSIKIFLNDYPIFTEYEERNTDFGNKFIKVRFNKGYNRLLVKIGTENLSDPYFCIRLLNEDLTLNTSCRIVKEPQNYTGQNHLDVTIIDSPLETFLKNQTEKAPENVYNYITLARYYTRMGYFDEAIDNIEKAYKLEPDNPLVLINKLYIYNKAGNKVQASEAHYLLKEKYPESLLSLQVELKQQMSREEYEEALKTWNKIADLYPQSLDYNDYVNKIVLYAKLEKLNEMIDLINTAYEKFPDKPEIIEFKALVEKKVYKKPVNAIKIYEKFLSGNFKYGILNDLIEEYQNLKQTSKAEKLIKEYLDVLPINDFYIKAINFYYVQQKYNEALKLCRTFLASYPFNSSSWSAIGNVFNQQKQKDSAIFCFKKAIEFNHNNYNVIAKLREIEGKEPFFNLDPHLTIEELNIDQYNNQKLSGDFAILYDHKTTLMYPEGGRESINTLVIKILNQKGIENFKESYLSDSDIEEHIIMDIFLMKPDKKKVFPNIYENNEIIWPSIEVGDILYIKYKTRYYFRGKMSKNLDDYIVFGETYPFFNSIHTYIIPNNKKINLEKINYKEKIVKIDSLQIQGEAFKIIKIKSDTLYQYTPEPYCPATGELAPALHVTTFQDWKEISDWYSDLTFSKFDENDIMIERKFKEIFPEGHTHLRDIEKAEKIYRFITSNISYLSNPLAQNNVIPQKASKTILNKLGDCKDLSVLFVTLAQKAGIKSHLILVRSRNKVQTPINQPNFIFDHCMVKFFDENNREYILELTDKNNPFLCLPNNSYKVWALDIPSKSVQYDTYKPFIINPATRKKESIMANYNFDIKDNQATAHIHIKNFGNDASNLYVEFEGKTNEEIKNYLYKKLSDRFEKTFEITDFKFYKDSTDTLHIDVNCRIDNYAQKIGDQKIIRIPYYYLFISQNVLNTENRQFDFVYEEYETKDQISDSILISLSSGEKFTVIPKNVSLTFNGTQYSLTFKKIKDNQLIITRKILVNRQNFPATLYPEFKKYGNKIIEAEKEYIGFKL